MVTWNDVHYVAALIEYIGRVTKNRRKDVAEAIGYDGMERLLQLACVNHCLTFEQVSTELIEQYGIQIGNFDSVGACKYKVPAYTSIGKDYARLVEDISNHADEYGKNLYEIMTSDFSDDLSNFNSSMFFASRAELAYLYQTQYRNLSDF